VPLPYDALYRFIDFLSTVADRYKKKRYSLKTHQIETIGHRPLRQRSCGIRVDDKSQGRKNQLIRCTARKKRQQKTPKALTCGV
jgi:hypothetical protein